MDDAFGRAITLAQRQDVIVIRDFNYLDFCQTLLINKENLILGAKKKEVNAGKCFLHMNLTCGKEELVS